MRIVFLVGDDSPAAESKECVIIDPASQADDFIKLIEKDGWKLKYILLTHAHYDHVRGIKKLVDKFSEIGSPKKRKYLGDQISEGMNKGEGKEALHILIHEDEFKSVKAGKGFIGEYSHNDFFKFAYKIYQRQ